MVKNINIQKRSIGVNFSEGDAEILVWAPYANNVALKVSQVAQSIPMVKQDFGYWHLTTPDLKDGQRYGFELITAAGALLKPDPAALYQPDGIYEFSQAYATSVFPWSDQNWKGIDIADYLIYELHTGTFSEEGTFNGIEKKLDYLIELGITAIEIMPVSQFPGNRNWGYDGVFPFAVQASYGGPLGLQQLVNACHQKGLSVILDVVYNHFGPEGSNFAEFAPYFTAKHHTPWGDAINFDDEFCDGVRHYFIENVLMWFRDFHIDALRLDAVHAIVDLSSKHILAEIKEVVDQFCLANGRKHHLIIECDLNDQKFIDPLERNGYGMDAQWLDEFHHALRVTAGQKRNGYYAEFNGVEHLAKSYQDAYVYDGVFSEVRNKTFGNKVTTNQGKQFVVFGQNHDQVGNRMLGERTSTLHSFNMQKLLIAAVLVSPYIPLLFMGEEYGETHPFLYFNSHSDKDLIRAVRKGRKAEFEAFHIDGEAPDPQDEITFSHSKLQWDLVSVSPHQQLLAYYKALIHLRKNHPVLNSLARNQVKAYSFAKENCLLVKRWQDKKEVICLFNFSTQAQKIKLENIPGQWIKIFDSEALLFGGHLLAPEMINAYNMITLAPETFIIYTNHHD